MSRGFNARYGRAAPHTYYRSNSKVIRVPVLLVPVISFSGTHGVGEDSVISGLSTLGTGQDAASSASATVCGTLGNGDISYFSSWYPWD